MNITLRLANYISRYAPSEEKITDYLTKKKISDPEKLLSEFWYDENLMLDMWMRTCIATAKWEREILQKLMKKWFPKEKIFQKIEIFRTDIENWDDMKSSILSRMQTALQKGKSTTQVSQDFSAKYPYFREQISEFLASCTDTSALQKACEKYAQKYDMTDKKQEQKFYAALMRKGFKYREIREFLDNKKEENF